MSPIVFGIAKIKNIPEIPKNFENKLIFRTFVRLYGIEAKG